MSRLVAFHPDDLAEVLALAERVDPSRVLAYLDGEDDDVARDAQVVASAEGGVRTLRVHGGIYSCDCLAMMLGGVTWASILSELQMAEADPSITGVLLDIDSPGGEVAGMQEVGHYVRSMSKPTAAYVRARGCSAAMYLARATGQIWAARTAQVGCVGVAMMVSKGTDGDQAIISSLTPAKNLAADTPAGLASAQQAVDDLAAEMLGDMAAWSGLPDAAAAAEFYQRGDTLIATRAIGLGWLTGLSVSPPTEIFTAGQPATTVGVQMDDEEQGVAAVEPAAEDGGEMTPEEKAARIAQLEDELRQLKGEPMEPEGAPDAAAVAFADRLVAEKAINPADRGKWVSIYQRDARTAMEAAPKPGAAYRDPTGSSARPPAVAAIKSQADAVKAARALADAEFKGDYTRGRAALVARNPNTAIYFGG